MIPISSTPRFLDHQKRIKSGDRTPAISTGSSALLEAKSDGMIPAAATFRFLDLPFELRQFVYTNLIDYRNPTSIASILRVNKQVNVEAMAVMLRNHYLVYVRLECHSPLLEVIHTRPPHIRGYCTDDDDYDRPIAKWLMGRTMSISIAVYSSDDSADFRYCKQTFCCWCTGIE